MAIHLGICNRPNLCVDCDSEDCGLAGDPQSDCPKWECDRPDIPCEECDFLREYVEEWRKNHERPDKQTGGD